MKYVKDIKSLRWSKPKLVAGLVLGVTCLVILFRVLPVELFPNMVAELCKWTASMGMWGPFILGLIDAVGVAICFPFTVAFELAAGFLFGVVPGSIVISIAKTCGAAAGLLLGRTLLKGWVQTTLKGSPHFSEVYETMSQDTFKLAVMLRLSPVPSWVNNYGLALTPISLRDFFLATILAGLPGVIRNVYIGSLMKSISAPDQAEVPVWIHWTMGALTIIASVLVTRYLYKYLKMALQPPSSESESTKSDKGSVEEDIENHLQPNEIPRVPTPAGASISRISTPATVPDDILSSIENNTQLNKMARAATPVGASISRIATPMETLSQPPEIPRISTPATASDVVFSSTPSRSPARQRAVVI